MFDPDVYCAGAEVDKCRDRLMKYCVGDGLDIGCGGVNCDNRFYQENKIVPTAIGVDLARTNLRGSATDLRWFCDACLDYIFSSHLLEHIESLDLCLIEWFRVLKPGGVLVLYLPLKGHYPCVGEPKANRDHKHNLTPKKVLSILDRCKLLYDIVLIEERTDDNEYSFDFVVIKTKGA
jgi:predicted SAM-dependent methyltransferase